MNAEMVVDLMPILPDKTLFERQDWSYLAYVYESLKEELPIKMLEPNGQSMSMSVFIYADHAGDLITQRSRICFTVFLNNAPIVTQRSRIHMKQAPLVVNLLQ